MRGEIYLKPKFYPSLQLGTGEYVEGAPRKKLTNSFLHTKFKWKKWFLFFSLLIKKIDLWSCKLICKKGFFKMFNGLAKEKYETILIKLDSAVINLSKQLSPFTTQLFTVTFYYLISSTTFSMERTITSSCEGNIEEMRRTSVFGFS